MSLIPTAVYDQHVIILGKTRSGKSSVGRGMAEHLLDREEPVCVIDPKGDWWGIKSSADGKHAGYKVVIFGGEHGDVPINERSGSAVAELAATENRPCVIDLGGWMPGARTQFFIEFALTYFRTVRGKRHLIIDEVHNFCPKAKILSPQAGMMLHWANRLASEGLGKGIQLIAMSQRPQKVHNDFLTSCETLIAMRVIHAADRKAFEDWIDGCGDPDQGAELVKTVASMQRGEAWVWSPEAGFGPKRIQFPMFKTYDSFKPQNAQHTGRLKGWADVNLDEVKKKLEAVVKEAEANDPEKLKARVRELEAAAKRPQPVFVGDTVKAAIGIDAELRELQKRRKVERRESATALTRLLKFLREARSYSSDAVDRVSHVIGEIEGAVAILTKEIPGEIQKGEPQKRSVDSVRQPSPSRDHHRPDVIADDSMQITPYQVDILRALAELAELGRHEIPVAFAAAAAGKSSTSSTWDKYISNLNARAYLRSVNGMIELTPAGRYLIPENVNPPTAQEVQERLKKLLTPYQRDILDVLIEEHGRELSIGALADRAGKSDTSSTFDKYLSSLSGAGIIERVRGGGVKAAPWLFLE